MNTAHHTAMMASQTLPGPDGDGRAPDWIHLLPAPADGRVLTADARGPYSLAAAQEIISNTLGQPGRDRIEVDVNHSTFLAAPRGERSDAVGWIVEMQARADGIWGRVEWTAEGEALVKGRAYRSISPVVIHDKAKRIFALHNASLVNKPNLRGLVALHQENTMNLLSQLAEMLGLPADATEEQALEALRGKLEAKPETAMQAQMSEIGTALGLTGEMTADTVIAAARAARQGGATTEQVTALQSELADVVGKLKTVQDSQARDKAVSFVDGEIKRGRVGVKGLRDHYVAMHMADPARVEKEIGGLPVLTGGVDLTLPPATNDGEIALNAEQLAVARHLGMTPKDFTAALEAERAKEV